MKSSGWPPRITLLPPLPSPGLRGNPDTVTGAQRRWRRRTGARAQAGCPRPVTGSQPARGPVPRGRHWLLGYCPSGLSLPPCSHSALSSASPPRKAAWDEPCLGPLVFLLPLCPLQEPPLPQFSVLEARGHPLNRAPHRSRLLGQTLDHGLSPASQHPLRPGPFPSASPPLTIQAEATLNPPHKAPSSLRPAWILSSSRKPFGPHNPGLGGPVQRPVPRATDSGLHAPPPPPTDRRAGEKELQDLGAGGVWGPCTLSPQSPWGPSFPEVQEPPWGAPAWLPSYRAPQLASPTLHPQHVPAAPHVCSELQLPAWRLHVGSTDTSNLHLKIAPPSPTCFSPSSLGYMSTPLPGFQLRWVPVPPSQLDMSHPPRPPRDLLTNGNPPGHP